MARKQLVSPNHLLLTYNINDCSLIHIEIPKYIANILLDKYLLKDNEKYVRQSKTNTTEYFFQNIDPSIVHEYFQQQKTVTDVFIECLYKLQ